MTSDRYTRAKEVFLEVYTASSQRREEILDQVCGDDSELRAEVEDLLLEHDDTGELPIEPVERTRPDPQHEGGRQSIGSYRLLERIGEGGMGAVYRARDTSLGRDVAIKFLHEDLAKNAERLARFEREARLLASLNHPNVATVHGFGSEDETRFLVMELVEGEDLLDMLQSGAIAVGRALSLFLQIAEGLEAAHERGIVHRDLKPGNLRITDGDKVKILDFGLARSEDRNTDTDDLTSAPTRTVAATTAGQIIGTAAYMSPEQARGQEVDARTDIWAFGCCLYEALVGEPAFSGDTRTDTLVAVLEREPDWQMLPTSTPVNIRALVRRCLEKDPRRRLHSIADARIEIEDSLNPPESEPPLAATLESPTPSGARRALLWSLAASGATVATLLLFLYLGGAFRQRSAPEVTKLSVESQAARRLLTFQPERPMALSPDGRQLVYVYPENGVNRLYLRALDQFDAEPLTGTTGAWTPAFSPDGEHIAFFAEGELRTVSLRTKAVQSVCAVDHTACYVVWENDDSLLFTPDAARGIHRVPADGGVPEPVTTANADENEFRHMATQVLPGGKHALITVVKFGGEPSDIEVIALDSGERQLIARSAAGGHYLAPGYLLSAHDGRLVASPFELAELRITGSPVPVLEGVRTDGGTPISLSSGGDLAYIPQGADLATKTLVWVDHDGDEVAIDVPPGSYGFPSLSSDGWLAIQVGAQVWIGDLSPPSPRLTQINRDDEQGPRQSFNPVWTPDSRHLAYSAVFEDQRPRLFLLDRQSGRSEPLYETATQDEAHWASSWSPDGQTLAFVVDTLRGETRQDIWVVSRDSGQASPLVRTEASEQQAAISPEGDVLAFESDRSGIQEIYVTTFPESRVPKPVSIGGGSEPVWHPDGSRLYYRSGNSLMVVSRRESASSVVDFTAPEEVFAGNTYIANMLRSHYAVSADGQRFLFIKPVDTIFRLNVVRNWGEEVRQIIESSR